MEQRVGRNRNAIVRRDNLWVTALNQVMLRNILLKALQMKLLEWMAAMKTRFKAALVVSLMLLCTSAALGQRPLTQEPETTIGGVMVARVNGMEPIPAVVTGMPYSSVTESETVQTGTDGTRFVRKMSRMKTYRDSQGRTRTEHYISMGLAKSDPPEAVSVMIRDPVARVEYILNSHTHTAREMVLHLPPPHDTTKTAVTHFESRPTDDRHRTKVRVEDLGTQTIDGLLLQGKKTTMTFPADAQGNDRPFEVVTERWFSKELETYILIKTNDPRSGEHTIKTTITDRREPDPTLFQVPADYTIEQKQ